MGQPILKKGLSRLLWLAVVCTSLAGCSRRLMGVFFDVPPAAPRAEVAADPSVTEGTIPQWLTLTDTVRPPIEALLDPEEVVRLLPRDHAGNIDWMEALRTGVIEPRTGVPDSIPDLALPQTFRFGFDFYLQGPNEQLDAFFPHSAHTEWVDCAQCHSRIFRYRDTPIAMADVFQGRYCGECHGKVAFPVTSACERCHTGLPMPPDRATPDLIGTVQMSRLAPDSVPAAEEVTEETPSSFNTESLPPAQFPHWVHRIRFTCKTCHMSLFEPRAGANRVTMADIDDGRACGACHNGRTAFEAGFNECHRCHVSPSVPAAAPVTDTVPPDSGDPTSRTERAPASHSPGLPSPLIHR